MITSFMQERTSEIAHVYETLNKVSNVFLKKIEVLEKDINKLNKLFELMGRSKMENCRHSENGYCTHQKYSSKKPHPQVKSNINKDGVYYPEVDALLCAVCPFYLPPID